MSDKLIIFDTTLRDGEQSPGASMTKDEKLRIARQLERLKVDVIEAGFAASSNGDFEAVKSIAAHVKDSIVCSLARANDRDISRAAEALKGAASSRIHTFIATSALHMDKKLRMTPDQVHEQAKLAVRFARNLTGDVEFSPEDGYRSDPDFLCRVLETVIAEGATTINIPDTVGYAIPELYGNFILDLRRRIPNADKAVWSVHCHNDLGMAVANSLAGVKIGGARQIECTINGLGERAGNCSLEEVVMAVKTRRDYFGFELAIDATQIVPASRLVSQTTGFVVQPNKAVVGANAFAHASGIHQDGVLKARDTYEIMRAEDVGWSTNKIVLGKLSGRNAFKQRLQDLGIELESEAEVNAAFAKFDYLVTPTTPEPAFPIGAKTDDPLSMYLSDVFTAPANLVGIPAIAIPSGFSREGLPLSPPPQGEDAQDEAGIGRVRHTASGTGAAPGKRGGHPRRVLRSGGRGRGVLRRGVAGGERTLPPSRPPAPRSG